MIRGKNKLNYLLLVTSSTVYFCLLIPYILFPGFSPFILTTSMKRTFEVSLMAVSQKWPVLLYGPVGSGKTALINKLASENRGIVVCQFTVCSYNKKKLMYHYELHPVFDGKLLWSIFSVLFIHMDDQMDSRTLVGSYVCTEQPGEFKWNPGSLTQVFFCHAPKFMRFDKNNMEFYFAFSITVLGNCKRVLDCF